MAAAHSGLVSLACVSSSTCIFLLAVSIIAYSLQNPTFDNNITTQSQTDMAKTYVKAMIAFGVLGFLIALAISYFAGKSHPQATNAQSMLLKALGQTK